LTTARRPTNSALRPSAELEHSLGVSPDWSAGPDEVLAGLGKTG
jgi:hypothetical protein